MEVDNADGGRRSEEERQGQSVRGNTEGLNTKTSVSSRKYPPVRVIANTRLCVMSRVVGVECACVGVCVGVVRR
jgi:hypothetical protein